MRRFVPVCAASAVAPGVYAPASPPPLSRMRVVQVTFVSESGLTKFAVAGAPWAAASVLGTGQSAVAAVISVQVVGTVAVALPGHCCARAKAWLYNTPSARLSADSRWRWSRLCCWPRSTIVNETSATVSIVASTMTDVTSSQPPSLPEG